MTNEKHFTILPQTHGVTYHSDFVRVSIASKSLEIDYQRRDPLKFTWLPQTAYMGYRQWSHCGKVGQIQTSGLSKALEAFLRNNTFCQYQVSHNHFLWLWASHLTSDSPSIKWEETTSWWWQECLRLLNKVLWKKLIQVACNYNTAIWI